VAFEIHEVSDCRLAAGSSISREVPGQPLERPQSYFDSYDSDTIFYDVFRAIKPDNGIVAIGPPLLNLGKALKHGSFSVNGIAAKPPKLRHLVKTDRLELVSPVAHPVELKIETEIGKFTHQVGANQSHLFSGLKVLVTKSKDNDLVWIHDWIEFHVRMHGVDGVLFYDNGSSSYTRLQLLETITSVGGLKSAIVVNWPFKFGPQGGRTGLPWDSDFCEYALMEHARWKYLQLSSGVLNADIDELVLSSSAKNIFELARAGVGAGITYGGRWVDAVMPSTARWATRRHRDFELVLNSDPACAQKWCADIRNLPKRAQMMTHKIHLGNLRKSRVASYRHFRGISNSWKYDRGEHHRGGEHHEQDHDLMVAMSKAWPADPVEHAHD
jgi:hypothetical protein